MIDSSSLDGLIDKTDLENILERLGYVSEPGEVEDILWEVDDDRDGGLTWEEFSSLYVDLACAHSCQQSRV
jgi:calmodulin